MRECLHIFRKDARRFWPYAAALLATRAAAAGLALAGGHLFLGPLALLVPLATCVLLAMVIQEDSPADDDAFWLTRPYHRMHLAAAKGLFALALICPPMLLADLLWFWNDGLLSPAAFAMALWRQALLIGWTLLGSAAIASVTRGVGQFLFGGVLMLLLGASGVEVIRVQSEWGAMAWMRGWVQFALFALAALAVVLGQYRRRRLWLARGAVLGAVLVVLLVEALAPWRTAYALQMRGAPAPQAVRMEFDAARAQGPIPQFPDAHAFGRRVSLAIPVRFAGLPAGQDVVGDALNLCVEQACTGWSASHELRVSPSGYWARFVVDRDWYARLAARPATLRVQAGLTLFADSKDNSGPVCRPKGEVGLICRTLDPSARVVALDGNGNRRPLLNPQSYGPQPWDVELISHSNRAFRIPDGERLSVITQRATGHCIREFSVPGVVLSAFRAEKP